MTLSQYNIFFIIILSIHFMLMVVCNVIGIEPIYKHITPFYATLNPINSNLYLSLLLPFTIFVVLLLLTSKTIRYRIPLSVVIIFSYFFTMLILDKNYGVQKILRESLLLIVAITFLIYITRNLYHISSIPNQNLSSALKVLFFLFCFSIILNISIASLRNGLFSIAEPYTRSKYEYVGDIGVTPSIFKLLKDYHLIQPNLSLHAKLAPPGPLILLWVSSYIFGRNPLNLAIFTIVFGSTAVILIYLWARELSKEFRTINPILFCILYATTPGIVIFTATASEILYMPILFLTLYLFEKSLNKNSFLHICIAGFSFAVLTFFKFTLLSIAIYFLVRGILYLISQKGNLLPLAKLAFFMLVSFIGFYLVLHLFTGYKPLEVFFQAYSLFRRDMKEIETISPRYSLWWFKVFNTWAWLYYAGIAISTGFVVSIFKKDSWKNPVFYLPFFTFLILNLAYIAPGEGERSSLYIYPFILLQALIFWNKNLTNSPPLFSSILIFQTVQSVLTECLFYTYW